VKTPIGFDASDYPKSMVSAGQLPLLVSPTISNVKLYHILIVGGATLNLISLAAFKKLEIPMGKHQPLRPFSGVGPVSVTPCGCISLPVTFGTAENFRMESVLFDVAIKNACYRQALRRYHQRFVQSRELQVDDLVLWWVLNREGMNKLSPC
jgi:hypothetical protein